jgi:hypothetical protein
VRFDTHRQEAATVTPRIHFIFDQGQSAAGIQAEISSRIADGHAGPYDVFYTMFWSDYRPKDPNWVPSPTAGNRLMGRPEE